MSSESRSRWIWLAVVATVTTVLLAGGWWGYDTLGEGDSSAGIVVATGRVEVPRVRLSSAVGGRVLDVTVQEGDDVAAGDLLVRFDSRELDASLAAASAGLGAAEANVAALDQQIAVLVEDLDLARTEARRYVRLAQSGAAPRQAADQAETALARLERQIEAAGASRTAASRGVDAARARVEALEARLDEMEITAPERGTIETQLVRAGEVAAPGQPLLELLREGRADVVVYLPLPEAERVVPGTKARVWTDAFPDRPFTGVVSRVSREAEFTPRDIHMPDERATLVFAVEVRIEDPRGVLKDGFPADVQFRVDPRVPWPEQAPW